MTKKTFSVQEFKQKVNQVLRNTTSEFTTASYRYGMISALECVLHDSGNYKGFRYLLESEVPAGELPGMLVNGTVENTSMEQRFVVGKTDSSRVEFF